MTATVTHAFVNPKVDGGDATIVRPIDWNAGHVITGLPGEELDYVQNTSGSLVTVTSITEATGTTIITSNSVSYDGTPIWIEFFCARVNVAPSAASRGLIVNLFESTTQLGRMCYVYPIFASGQGVFQMMYGRIKLTPTAASHTYTMTGFKSNASDTATLLGGGGVVPMYIRTSRA